MHAYRISQDSDSTTNLIRKLTAIGVPQTISLDYCNLKCPHGQLCCGIDLQVFGTILTNFLLEQSILFVA